MDLNAHNPPADPPIVPIASSGDRYDRGLWRLMFCALWLNASAMAGLILLPSNVDASGGVPWILWTLALAVVSTVACVYRIVIHDMMVDLQLRERLMMGIIVLIVAMLPGVVETTRILPDGLLWATPLMILLSAHPAIARRTLGWLLLGAWIAAFQTLGLRLYLLLAAFALTWLFAVGAVHFTFTGQNSGLSGRWAARRVLSNALWVSIPGMAVAAATLWLWPSRGPNLLSAYRPSQPGDPAPQALAKDIDPIHLMSLIWQGGVTLLLTMILFALLLLLRRTFLRHRRGTLPAELLPGQSAQMAFTPADAEPPPPSLQARRGVIVRLWGRWANRLTDEGFGRHPGETASQYAERLHRKYPAIAPPAEMTDLLEKAHYGQAEPTGKDEETMRTLVSEQLSRQSLRLQTPTESLDDI